MPTQPAPKMPPRTARPAGNRLRLRIAQLTDVGRARDHQEDAIGVFTPSDPALLARKGQLLIVADGMGGHNAGEVASQAAVAEIQRAYFAATTDDIPTSLRQAFQTANQAIRQHALGDAGRQGMGTTAAVAVVREREVQIANVGDSRVYLLREGAISQITQDHSWVEEQVRAGVLTPEQAQSHPQRNIITRALGTAAAVDPDLFSGVLQEGDVLLLCSDGLSNLVTNAELLEIAGQAPPEQTARRLVDLANERGGGDNISVIVARAEGPQSAAAAPVAARRRLPIALLGVVALVLIAAGVVAGILLARGGQAGARTPTLEASVTPPVGAVVTAVTATETMLAATKMATAAAVPVTAIAPTTGTVEPTATLRPSDTPRPSPTPRPTTQAPTATRTPRVTLTLTVPGSNLPAPQLSKPEDGFTAYQAQIQEFSWRWTGALNPTYRFQIFMRKRGNEDWQPMGSAVALGVNGSGSQPLIISTLSVVTTGGPGDYEWTVAVVNLAGARLSDYAPLRSLVYRSGGGPPATPIPPPTTVAPPSKTPVPPTDTPVPPTDTPVPPTNTPSPTDVPTETPTLEPTPK